MDFVVLESPFATRTLPLLSGRVRRVFEAVNLLYARACLKDCLTRYQEAPYASHLIYTQEGVLNDQIPSERDLGIRAGLEIGKAAKRRVFYVDRGFSSGMLWGYKFAQEIGQPCELRRLRGKWVLNWTTATTLDEIVAELRE